MRNCLRRFFVFPASKDDIRYLRNLLANMEERLMATLQEVQAAIAAEGAEVTARLNELLAEIQRLNDLIAAGGTITPADLDGLKDSIEAIFVSPTPSEPNARNRTR